MTKPTQEDMDFSNKITEYILESKNMIMTKSELKEIVAKEITYYKNKAVEAERQRMCDVAYEVYNESDMPEEWMDGAYAVIEAIGKEVK